MCHFGDRAVIFGFNYESAAARLDMFRELLYLPRRCPHTTRWPAACDTGPAGPSCCVTVHIGNGEPIVCDPLVETPIACDTFQVTTRVSIFGFPLTQTPTLEHYVQQLFHTYAS